jgi:hypothetical protein
MWGEPFGAPLELPAHPTIRSEAAAVINERRRRLFMKHSSSVKFAQCCRSYSPLGAMSAVVPQDFGKGPDEIFVGVGSGIEALRFNRGSGPAIRSSLNVVSVSTVVLVVPGYSNPSVVPGPPGPWNESSISLVMALGPLGKR